MKKLSISLFAIMAIALAVFSAFTTKQDAPKQGDPVWFLYEDRASNEEFPTDPGTTDFTKYDEYTSGNPITNSVCVGASQNEFVCALLLDVENEVIDDEIQEYTAIAFEIE